ncbi:MAG: flagellar motor protein MotA [Pseudomonadota bacterium]|nr:flagellar motor protein MotA [Nisaea sp.]MEC8006788.1 flagellar motor protein MotA [Pseudomonadota bacterium]MEC8181071.1 flagellar motor protein MotA [Pseudomonadota bacterium]MEC8282336.1 flagellar motor protein MotA [Pseudomonadota bacterium]MEC8318502.1 flagellar motor protein MotA [Pseudomonadota bacterium]
MTNPAQTLVRMIGFLIIVGIIAGFLYAPLVDAFLANPALNGMILAALLIGILFALRQVVRLRPEVAWIESFRRQQPGLSMIDAPRLLAPIAAMIGERRDERMSLSTLSLRSLLDSLATRLDESRDLSRYLIGLLIFLGLLGTFWGLLTTVGAVAQVIGNLSIESGNLVDVFANLKAGLESPLAGMATAFSSSLFGLAGSLILGFLDLQLGQAQNRFYNELEEWLSSLTRLSSGGGVLADGEVSATAYQQALLEQTGESLDKLQRIMSRNEDERRQSASNMVQLSERIARVADLLEVQNASLADIATSQSEVARTVARLGDMPSQTRDEVSRTHLRNIEALLTRQVDDSGEARVQAVEEIRQEIRLLARTIAALAEGER